MSTDHATQVAAPGKFERSEKTLPGPGKVRIHIEACGIGHPTPRRSREHFRFLGREDSRAHSVLVISPGKIRQEVHQ